MTIQKLFFLPQKTKYKFNIEDTNMDPPKYILASRDMDEMYRKKIAGLMAPKEGEFVMKNWSTLIVIMGKILAEEYPMQITSSATRRDSAKVATVLNSVFNTHYDTLKYVYEAYISQRMKRKKNV